MEGYGEALKINEANATKEKAERMHDIQKGGRYNLMVHLIKNDIGENQL